MSQQPNWQLEAEAHARTNQHLASELARTQLEKAQANARAEMHAEMAQQLQQQMNALQGELETANNTVYLVKKAIYEVYARLEDRLEKGLEMPQTGTMIDAIATRIQQSDARDAVYEVYSAVTGKVDAEGSPSSIADMLRDIRDTMTSKENAHTMILRGLYANLYPGAIIPEDNNLLTELRDSLRGIGQTNRNLVSRIADTHALIFKIYSLVWETLESDLALLDSDFMLERLLQHVLIEAGHLREAGHKVLAKAKDPDAQHPNEI